MEAVARRRALRVCAGPQGVGLTVDGRELVNVSSNDYLGLAAHPMVCAAMIRAVERHGAGSGASRLICGSRDAHAELEETLAAFKGTEAALTFGSGYAGALGVLGAVLQPGDVVVLDRLAHASLLDGARASGAAVRTFRHNRMDHLADRLGWARRSVAPGGRILVVTEAIFSMDGDRAPLCDIAHACRAAGALLLVDEAHSFGLCGRDGRGLADALGVADQVDLHFGTLSKAAGLAGGYVAGTRSAIDLILNRARPLIYSTAPPPAVAATAAFVIREIFATSLGRDLRDRVWSLAGRLAQRMGTPTDGSTPASLIFPVLIGGESEALRAADELRAAGYFAPAIRPPTVPLGQSRLRVTISAAHTREQIDGLAGALQTIARLPSPAALINS